MAVKNSVFCALCRRALSTEEIDSGKAIVMGTLKTRRLACVSHFYSDNAQRNRIPEYQLNINVMAMLIVWSERGTTDSALYQRVRGDYSMSGKQALVVEDHRECAEFLKMILEEEEYEVRLAETGDAALQVFASATNGQEPNFVPDIVLLDLRLPDMSGVDLVEELRRRQLAIPPTVMLSAGSTRSLDEARKRVGIIGLRKPFDFVSLFSAIAVAQCKRKTLSDRN